MFKKALTGERERERESGTIILKNVVYLVFRRFVVAMELERHRLEVSLLLQNHH